MVRNTERSKPESKQDSSGGEHVHLKVQNAVEASALWTCRWRARLPLSSPLCSAKMESESAIERDPETTDDERDPDIRGPHAEEDRVRCGCSAERRAAVKEHRGAHLYCWGIEEVTRFFSVISNPDNAVSLHSVALFFWSYPFFSLWQFPTLFRFPIIPLLYHFYTIFIPFFSVCRFRVCAAALRLFLCSVKPDGEHSHCHLRRRRR